jgi:hypothetical protein
MNTKQEILTDWERLEAQTTPSGKRQEIGSKKLAAFTEACFALNAEGGVKPHLGEGDWWEGITIHPRHRLEVTKLAKAHGVELNSNNRYECTATCPETGEAVDIVAYQREESIIALVYAKAIVDTEQTLRSVPGGLQQVSEQARKARELRPQVRAAHADCVTVLELEKRILEYAVKAANTGSFGSDPSPASALEETLAKLLEDDPATPTNLHKELWLFGTGSILAVLENVRLLDTASALCR